jgi:hypothetical protein
MPDKRMPLFFQLQVWFCFGPVIAAVLLIPSVVGMRPALANATPSAYLSEMSTAVICSETCEVATVPSRRSAAFLSSVQPAPVALIARDAFLGVVSFAVNPISPRAP